MKELDVALRLSVRDNMSRTASQSFRNVQTDSQRLFQARETLGVRSETRIQREIRQTEMAYQRLAAAGTMSAREQARAFDAMRVKLAELRREMGQVSALQRGMGMAGGAMRGLQTVAGAGMGLAAGAYVLSRPAGAQMGYDRRLAMMANTAYTNRDTEGRAAGMRTLEEAVKSAVRFGGGSKDQAAETLDQLISSGVFSVDASVKMLPTLQRFGTGSGASPTELSQIALAAQRNFKIKPEALGKALDMALVAGQEGGFELKDMAKWLPQQMAAASNSGLSGLPGFAKLLAANQAAVVTAGTKDQAGNNLYNLLGKINSSDTANDAKKLGIKDWAGALARGRELGQDSIDTFLNITESLARKDKGYQRLQARLKTVQGDDRRATLESMADILHGSAIGKLVQDREAMSALVALLNNRGYVREVQGKTMTAEGANERNFELVSRTPSFKVEQAKNEADFAQNSAFAGFNQVIGDTAEKLTAYAREYPGLTSALAGATTGLIALTAASAGMGLGSALRGGGAGTAGIALRTAGRVGLPLFAAGAAGYGVGTLLNSGINSVVERATGEKGATLGSKVYDWMHPTPPEANGVSPLLQKLEKQAAAIEALSKVSQSIVVPVKVTLDGTVMAEYTNTLNTREARRH